jgi:hypothetical protein
LERTRGVASLAVGGRIVGGKKELLEKLGRNDLCLILRPPQQEILRDVKSICTAEG